MAPPPSVLYPLALPALLHHVLSTPWTAKLIVCCTREAFLSSLATAFQEDEDGGIELATPTLHRLATARHVKVAFCASVQALLAYLSALQPPDEPGTKMVLVNVLCLHAATPHFSAQGLSRTFAAAVEASLRTHAQLVVAECLGRDGGIEGGRDGGRDGGIQGGREGGIQGGRDGEDVWEQDVSILNVSASKFGDGAWAGRTVKAKSVVGRWCRFRELSELDHE